MTLSLVESFVDDGTPALPLLVSRAIPGEFRHGFTTRHGGVSGAPFDTLNLGMKWGDSRHNVLENRRRLLGASGADAIYFAAQVHGAGVIRVCAGDPIGATALLSADAVCSDAASCAAAVYVADCVPLLIVDPKTGAFAAVHAGWRGAVAGVQNAAVASLGEHFGARPSDLRVAMGPAIGRCCFEVGPDVAAAFHAAVPQARGGEVVIPAREGKAYVDIKRACQMMLEAQGVPASSIDASPECTKCDPQGRFYSYRRDAGQTGQHLAFVYRQQR